MKHKRHNVSADEFCRVWEESDSAGDAAAKLGLRPRNVSERASRLRRIGVPLKRMIGGRPATINVKALAAQVREQRRQAPC